MTHDLSTGFAFYGNKESWGDDVYEYAGTSNIYRPVVVPPRSDLETGPASVRRKDNERALFVQDIVGITSELTLHAGARYVKLKRDELGVVYQLCVAPGVQRKLVGAALVKAAFERFKKLEPRAARGARVAQPRGERVVADRAGEDEGRVVERSSRR